MQHGNLIPWTRIKTWFPALEVRSSSHWTTRKSHGTAIIFLKIGLKRVTQKLQNKESNLVVQAIAPSLEIVSVVSH